MAAITLSGAGCGGSAAQPSAGTQPAAAAAAPAAAAAVPLFIQADTVRGGANITKDQQAEQSCVLDNRFAHNEELVWRVRVLDPQTGKQLDDKALKSVAIKLADGTTVAGKYGSHPSSNPTDHFWAASWTVPAGYPTGTLDYSITAVGNDGRQGTFVPFDVASSLVAVTAAVRPTVSN